MDEPAVIAEEQAHLKRVDAALDDELAELRRTDMQGAADEFASQIIEHNRALRRFALEAPGAPYFAAIAADQGWLRIGRTAIFDPGDDDLLVINWRSEAAVPFYEATTEQPLGLTRRRRVAIADQHVVAVGEERLDTTEEGIDASLAAAVEAAAIDRTGHMASIVATIRPDQHRMIASEDRGTLVIQGGPGTGKTAVGLHRAAWLTYRYPEIARGRILVVGPNRGFLRYIEEVLPGLGERPGVQRTIREVGPRRATVTDDPAVAAMKGDQRMAGVLRASLYRLVRQPEAPLVVRIQRRRVELDRDVVADHQAVALANGRTYLHGRTLFRDALAASILEQVHFRVSADLAELDAELRRNADLQDLLAALWPSVSAERFVGDLLASPRRLREAGDGLDAVHRTATGRGWTLEEVALLDEVGALLDGCKEVFGHVVVDEAQELSAMQLGMLHRRARNGSITILGDLAQAARIPAPSGWDELVGHLPGSPPRLAELTTSYRVPRPFVELAARLLATINPALAPPIGVRDADRPVLRQAPDATPAATAVALAVARVADGGIAALIAPRELHAALRAAARRTGLVIGGPDTAEAPVRLLATAEAKGLEFDHVIVVAPTAILAGPAGAAAMYVALTRATRTLALVDAEQLPALLAG